MVLIVNALSPIVADAVSSAGYDAIHVRDRGLAKAKDAELFALAAREARVVVFADTDFGTLLALHRVSKPSIILFRHGVERRQARDCLPFCQGLFSLGYRHPWIGCSDNETAILVCQCQMWK